MFDRLMRAMICPLSASVGAIARKRSRVCLRAVTDLLTGMRLVAPKEGCCLESPATGVESTLVNRIFRGNEIVGRQVGSVAWTCR